MPRHLRAAPHAWAREEARVRRWLLRNGRFSARLRTLANGPGVRGTGVTAMVRARKYPRTVAAAEDQSARAPRSSAGRSCPTGASTWRPAASATWSSI